MATRQRLLTTTELAQIIDRTPAMVRKLTADGVIRRARDDDGNEIMGRYNLLAIRDYIRHVHGRLKQGETGEQLRDALRNRSLLAQAELAEMEVKKRRGELIEVKHVEFVVTNILTYFKTRILALPSRISRQCVGKSFRQIFDIITREIETVLRELSTFSVADFTVKFAREEEDYLAQHGVEKASLNGEEDDQADDDSQAGA